MKTEIIKKIKILLNNSDICEECKETVIEELNTLEEIEDEDKKLFESSIDEMRKGERIIEKKDIGIFSNKSIIPAIIRDNVINSNLISDIKNIPYTKTHTEHTRIDTMCLKKLDDLPPFIDDLYGWTYFSKNQGSKIGNRYTLEVEKSGISDIIINEINTSIKRAYGSELYEKFGRTKIAFTPSINSNGKIETVIKEQEERTEQKILKKFLELNEKEFVAGYIKFKVDTSDLSINEFQKHVEELDKTFYNKAYGLYSIDCTRDYAGSLNRKKFLMELEYLGFKKEEDLFNDAEKEWKDFHVGRPKKQEIIKIMEETIKKKNLKVIVNEKDTIKASGTNIVKYYYFINGRKIEVKFYNKLVSNYESRGVQDIEGSHLSEHVYNNKNVLMKTFYHPEIIKHGVTRCEITINGFNENENINYLDLLDEEYERIGRRDIFYSVPIKKQWKTLENAIDKNAVFCNRATGDIIMVWFASSITGKFGGVGGNVVKSMKNLKKDLEDLETYEEKEKIHQIALKEWNNGILSVVSNFGFRNTPIYVIDFDVIEKTKIKFFKNRLFMKRGPTILTPYTFPNTEYSEETQNNYPPSFMMPESDKVKWMWRTKELNSKRNLGKKRIYTDFFDFIEIEKKDIIDKIELFTLSKRQRSTLEKKLLNKKIKEEFKKEIQEKLNEQVQKCIMNEENEERLREVFKKEKRKEKIKTTIGEIFKKPINQKRSVRVLKELKTFFLYGFKESEGLTKLCYFKEEEEENTGLCYAHGEIIEQIKELKKSLFKEVDPEFIKYKKKEPVFFSPYKILQVDCSEPLNLKIINIENILKEHEEDINFTTIKKVDDEEIESIIYETLKELKHEKKNVRDVDDIKEETKLFVLGFSKSSSNKTEAYYHLFVRDEKNKEFFIKGNFLQSEIFNTISTKGELNTLITPIVLVIGPKKYNPVRKRSFKTVSFIFPEIKESEKKSSKDIEIDEEELEWDNEKINLSFLEVENKYPEYEEESDLIKDMEDLKRVING